MGWLLSLFGGIGLQTWIIVGGVILIGSNAITGIKVAHYVRTGYENVNLKNEVKFVERERKVAVLDRQAVEEAVAKERTRNEREAQEREILNELWAKHKTSDTPWCGLDDNELRIWNDENTFLRRDGTPVGSKVPDRTTIGGDR